MGIKVLHVLESSIPDTGGYTIRARAIVDHQRRLGLDPVVVTSPLFPARTSGGVEVHDGVRYYRTNNIAAPVSARLRVASYAARISMLRQYRRAVLKIAKDEKVEVVHAHSSYTNALAAMPAAHRLHLPLIYEVRTLWGESAVVENQLRPASWKHRLVWALELLAMRGADAVVAIAHGIEQELLLRGVAPERVVVIPNGVDVDAFPPRPRDESLASELGLSQCFVAGYIGSVRRLEGLSILLDAARQCQQENRRLGVVIVGGGQEVRNLEDQARRQGVRNVVIRGNVPHEDIARWYSIMDALVYPRVRALVNERVTPLKPLEAMAQGKVCVASDVGGLMELIAHERTGVLFPSGSSDALATTLKALMDDPARMKRLGCQAVDYVARERNWREIVGGYLPLYEKLMQATARPTSQGDADCTPTRYASTANADH